MIGAVGEVKLERRGGRALDDKGESTYAPFFFYRHILNVVGFFIMPFHQFESIIFQLFKGVFPVYGIIAEV